ncbi:MAG: DUF1579 family protein [Planctomycetota bacterium]
MEESVREASASLDEISPEADMAQMMARMAEIGTTGIEHERLQPMLGTFNATVRYWMMPGEGRPVHRHHEELWILGGRFLQGDYSGTFEGMPFVDLSLTGYDKVRGKYVGSWVDSSSTATGQHLHRRDVQGWPHDHVLPQQPRLHDRQGHRFERSAGDHRRQHHRMSMWGPAPDGTWFKMMVIDYSRAR